MDIITVRLYPCNLQVRTMRHASMLSCKAHAYVATYIVHKLFILVYRCYKSPKQEQRRQRNIRSHDDYDDRAASNAHQNSPPVPATPVLQPMTV